LQKNRVEKSKTDFFSILFYHVFGRFSVRGVQKHDKKISKINKSDPSPFLASDPPTHHGGHRFLFIGGPLATSPPASPGDLMMVPQQLMRPYLVTRQTP
jgi:hypothetical protein